MATLTDGEGGTLVLDPAAVNLPRLVPGTSVVALLLCTGRWGSYLGLPSQQIYLTDVLLVITSLWTLIRCRSAVRAAVSRRGIGRIRLLAPILALSSWALVRSLPSITAPDALRDLAPYVYISVALLLLVPCQAKAVASTLRVLAIALIVHAAWLTVSLVVPSTVASLPLLGGMVRVLEVRADYDGATMAMLAGLALCAVATARSWRARVVCVLVAAWASVLVLLLANRASLIALILALAVSAVSAAPRIVPLWRHHRRLVIGVLAAIAVVAVIVVPRTPTYQRLAGSQKFAQSSASGTTAAREEAWTQVLRYIDSRPSRVVVGVGAGPDFLLQSGAASHYQAPGEPVVRQPHNFAINTYARLGAVGVVLLAWLLIALAAAAVGTLRRLDATRALSREMALLDVTGVLLCTALLVTAMLGVILEAPFGALPFGWAAGLLLLGGSRCVSSRP